jgi:uncharacterized protein YdhG (YjbR/CyaY superfamily)
MAMSKAKDVKSYIAAVPEPGRSTLKKLRAAIRAAAPRGATEVISYGIPYMKYEGGLLAYAAFKKHCSLFPMLSKASYERFAKALKPYRTSTGTLQFPLDEPVPPALVKRIVKTRVAENLARKKLREARKKK